jgi:hypothetical protein
MTINFAPIVANGIALLDAKGPSGWRAKVNLDTLNMRSAYDCILGQVYGEYGDGLTEVFSTAYAVMSDRWSHGFSARYHDDYDALTAAWREALSAPVGALNLTPFTEVRTTTGNRVTFSEHFFFDGHGIMPGKMGKGNFARNLSGALHGSVKVTALKSGRVSLRDSDGILVHLSSGFVVVDGIRHTLAALIA